jgi:threonine 3-dehydrogenase
MAKNTMLAVIKEKKAPGIVIKRIPVVKTPKGEVKIKVLYASICGTDISIYDWTPWVAEKLKPPIVIGHEVVGEIVEINGDAPHLKIGDIVSSETHIFDNTCYQCRINNRHICENVKFFGYGRNGGFSEYATIPIQTTWKNDERIPLKQMSVQEPLGNSVNVITKAKVHGKTVVIFGLGPTGLCAVAVAKAYGASRVIGINRGEYRRKLALDMGADEVYDKLPKKYESRCDVVIEMTGNADVIDSALKAARIAGVFVFFGIPKKAATIDIGEYIINKELRMESVFGRRIWETWHQVSDLLVHKKVDLSKIITHEFALKDFEKAMEIMRSGECGKILLIP